MSRFARFVVRRRRAVLLTRLVVIVATLAVGSSAFEVLSTDFGAGTTTESGRVAHELDELSTTGGQLAVVVDGADTEDPAFQAGLTGIAELEGVLDVSDPLPSTDGEA